MGQRPNSRQEERVLTERLLLEAAANHVTFMPALAEIKSALRSCGFNVLLAWTNRFCRGYAHNSPGGGQCSHTSENISDPRQLASNPPYLCPTLLGGARAGVKVMWLATSSNRSLLVWARFSCLGTWSLTHVILISWAVVVSSLFSSTS